MPKNKAVAINRTCYAMASKDGQTAEITMYGDIVESRPVDFFTGESVDGQYITLDEFLSDLDQIENCTEINIRMNSYGGDAVVSNIIHNRLREMGANGVKLSCVVDGVAMSGGSLIMCACDNVRVNPSSLIMIHKSWSTLIGGYNADELRDLADRADAYDKMQVAIYQRKTGLSETILLHMMSDTTYMTGKEAVEKGFADELIEDAADVDIAASADRRTIYCKGQKMHLAPGMLAPASIPIAAETVVMNTDEANNQPVNTGAEKEVVAMTIEELREQYPELVSEVEANAIAGVDHSEAVDAAVAAERTRLQEIDEVSALFSSELVQTAKYGTPCTAQELAYRAARTAAAQGHAFLSGLEEDANTSGVDNIGAAPAPQEDIPMTAEQKQAQANDVIHGLLHDKKEA